MKSPDVIGEVVGFRSWIVDRTWRRGGEVLLSLNGEEWPGGAWMVAECEKLHSPPDEKCACGIYAAKSSRHLVRLGYHVRGNLTVVVGEVGLAGTVIPGTQGWRAEKARPLRLWLPWHEWDSAWGLEKRYGVKVELANTFRPVEVR